jgi:AraC-like DNA-binding protein
MTVDRAAEACGYASRSSLARALKEFTSLPPSALSMTDGPFAVVAAAFSEEVLRHRAQRGERRRRPTKGTES